MPWWGTSNEYQQHTFSWRNKKNSEAFLMSSHNMYVFFMDKYFVAIDREIFSSAPFCWFKKGSLECALILLTLGLAGLGGSVGCTSDWWSGGCGFDPAASATFFCGDWSWNIFYGHNSPPFADSRRAVISFWQKNVHNTQVICLED